MGFVALLSILFFVTSLISYLIRRYAYIIHHIGKIPGPSSLPIIGNLHQFKFKADRKLLLLSLGLLEFFEQVQGVSVMFQNGRERICRVWLGPSPFVVLYGAEECEAVLGSNKMLTKLFVYNFLSPWIGQGLLISKPEKWRPRRKLLTPTFHYDILKDFVEVYNRHATTLIGKFDKLVGNGYNDVFHTISLCTLDIICESALGTNIDAQNVHTDYLDAVFGMKTIIHQRNVNPFYHPNILFNLIGHGKDQQKYVKILHDFTSNAINERKALIQAYGGFENYFKREKSSGHGRMAFLDVMLGMLEKGDLDKEGLQEEVDTFTFEGHDTTSAAMNFFLHLMGANPDVQEKVHREIDDIVGDTPRDLTFDDIGRLKYLEACFKETLRLYPSVPLIARQVTEEVMVGNHTLPPGTGVVIIPSMVHKDPKYWENPDVFNPERFIDGELKHPYSYIPFSAGSRNCIGQRFAMMEEKCVIARILREFKVKSKVRTDQLRLSAELIIRPMYGNYMKFERRSYGDYSQLSS